jgi:hypothetical protein
MPAMLAYVLRRVFQSLLVLLVVGLVAFAMFRYVGDPVENMLGQERTQADIERLRQQLGLDQPFPVQYCGFPGTGGAGQFRAELSAGPPGVGDPGRTAARDAGAGLCLGRARAGWRHRARHLHRHPAGLGSRPTRS